MPPKRMYSYELVPWYSWEEWREVHKNIFGNKTEDWRKAYEQISVWKSRVPKLAVGIESTIPLLHAQIAMADHSIEDSFRNSILNMAILRFVSIVTKGYEDRYLLGKPMHNLATRMNLPPYLIDLRHEIIHSDSVFGTSQTLESALESSLQWIKIHYWEEEEAKMKMLSKMKKSQKRTSLNEGVAEEEDANAESSEDSQNLRTSIREYVVTWKSLRKRKAFVEDVKEKQAMVETQLEVYFCRSPEDSMKIIVAELFYSSYLQKHKGLDNCSCRCFLPKKWVSKVSFVMRAIIKLHTINIFVKALINQGEVYPPLCAEWIRLLANTASFGGLGKSCLRHRFVVDRPRTLRKTIRWKEILYQLFSLGKQWSSTLALELCDYDIMNSNSNSRAVLKELSDIYAHSMKRSENCHKKDATSETLKVSIEGVSTLEDVMQEARKASENVFSYVEDVCSLVQNTSVKGKKRRMRYTGTPLGVLPHQEGDPYFFQQLILQPSESPNKFCKRTKFRNTSTA